MPFFRCPGCQIKLSVKPEHAGHQFQCPRCRAMVIAPAADNSSTGPSGAVPLTGKPISTSGTPREGAATPAVEAAPAWSPGLVLLDDYLVEQLLGSGGMGDVYLARSRTTGEPYAVKRIRPHLIQDPRHRKNFLKELRSWVDLPSHPHLVACRFFRTVGDEVIIFAEFVEGGSLHTCIREGRVSNVEAVLDVAIQMAWGLEAAHRQGLIHQDVKPANVLLYDDLFLEDFHHAKVTDFGLAKARAVISKAREPASAAGQPAQTETKGTPGAGTPAYWSPEQAAGATVSARADVWGFGVTLVETLLGKRTWTRSSEAAKWFPQWVEEHQRGTRVFHIAPPDSLLAVITRCLQRSPGDRWPSMHDLAEALIKIYAAEIGRPYPRSHPQVIPTLPAGGYSRRNGRGVAWSDPEVWLKKALRLAGTDADPEDWLVESTPGSRRARAIDDLMGYEEAYDVYARRVAEGHRELEAELAALSFEKALVHETAGDVTGALVLYDRAIGLYASSAGTKLAASVERLEVCYTSKGQLLSELGNLRAAGELFDKAIALTRSDKQSGVRPPPGASTAAAYAGKGLVATKSEDYATAVDGFDRAIAILDRQASQSGSARQQDQLASVVRDKALAVARYGQLAGRQSLSTLDQYMRQSIGLYDKAIALYDHPAKEQALRERAIEQARCFSNQGNALWRLGDTREALRAYDHALAFLKPLERPRVDRELAIAWTNKAVAEGDWESESETMEWYGQAAEALERLVRHGNRRELTRELAVCLMNHGCALATLGNDQAAGICLDRAAKLLERELHEQPLGGAHEDLALCYMNKAVPLGRRGQVTAATELLNRAMETFDGLARQGRPSVPADVGLCWMNLGTQLWRSGKQQAAIETYDRAIGLLDAWFDRKGPSPVAVDLALCHLNKALAYHQLGRSWYAGWSLRRAGLLLLRSVSPEVGLVAPEPAIKTLFALFSEHEGWPGRAAAREFLRSQTAQSAGGALNRMHKQTLDLL